MKKIDQGIVKILKATISQKGSKYYVSLTLEEVIFLVESQNINSLDLSKVIGIDLGLKTFATIHNGSKTDSVEKKKYIRASEEKLAKLQRKLVKKTQRIMITQKLG